jgi:multiple sugar transport system permease protein
MMYAYFRDAEIDGRGGAGRRLHALGAFWSVAVPLAAPGIVAAAVFAFIACWTEFFFASS